MKKLVSYNFACMAIVFLIGVVGRAEGSGPIFTKTSDKTYLITNIVSICDSKTSCEIIGPDGIQIKIKDIFGNSIGGRESSTTEIKSSVHIKKLNFVNYYRSSSGYIPGFDSEHMIAINSDGSKEYKMSDSTCEDCYYLKVLRVSNLSQNSQEYDLDNNVFLKKHFKQVKNIIFESTLYEIASIEVRIEESESSYNSGSFSRSLKSIVTSLGNVVKKVEKNVKEQDAQFVKKLNASIEKTAAAIQKSKTPESSTLVQEEARQLRLFTIVLNSKLFSDYKNTDSLKNEIEYLHTVPEKIRAIYEWPDSLAGSGSKALSALANTLAIEVKQITVALGDYNVDEAKAFSWFGRAAVTLRNKVDAAEGGDMAAGVEVYQLMQAYKHGLVKKAIERIELSNNGDMQLRLELVKSYMATIEELTKRDLESVQLPKGVVGKKTPSKKN